MFAIGTTIDLCILWFLIVLFTDSTDSKRSLTETWIVIFGVATVGVVFGLVLGESLQPLVVVLQLATLYFLVAKFCGTERRTTLKICGSYLVVTLGVAAVTNYLSQP